MRNSTRRHILTIALLCIIVHTALAQNNPYVDDKLIHFGFSLGLDFLSYSITDNEAMEQIRLNNIHNDPTQPKDTITYHARVGAPGIGFAVGFITDLRLTRHLNLRFCPALHFGERTITYTSEQIPDSLIRGNIGQNNKPHLLSLPISVPLYIKWSAEREINYRPYVIAGGGISYEVMQDKEKVILPKPFDYFVELGFGCDFYFRWFKFCPEIKYRIGFNNVITPISEAGKQEWGISESDYFYTNTIQKMTNQQISLIFNFE